MRDFEDLIRIFNYESVRRYYGSLKETCITKDTPKETANHIKEVCKAIRQGKVILCPENESHGNFMFLI